MKMASKAIRVLIALAVLSIGGHAFAASGVISGSFSVWNKNGNFCDDASQDCTGATYLKSVHYDRLLPFRNGHVELWRGTSVIGQGSTDDNGNFTISWKSQGQTNSFLRFFAQDGNNHFVIEDTNGLRMNTNSGTFTVHAGTTSADPQPVGAWADASVSAGATWYDNVYWGAALEWTNAFSLSGALASTYNNVEIRGVAVTMNNFLGQCPTSCAQGSTTRIQLDSVASALSPQARIMHESGHVANYLLNPYHMVPNGAYCWDTNGSTSPVPPATSCGWGATGPEWASAQFEEALATFSADNTLWFPNAVDPTSCNSQGACPLNANTRIEESHYPFTVNNCDVSVATPESRQPISVQRTLWDIYDDHFDCDGDSVAEGNGFFWHMYANMQTYAAGIADHAIDEPWSSTSYTTVTKWDGRAMSDYVYHYGVNYSTLTTLLSADNCSPL